MAISTYAELVTALGNWLHRDGLTNRIPEFIVLGEARIGREVEARQMEQRVSTPAATIISLPSDYMSMRAVRIRGATIGWLDYMTPDEFFRTTASSSVSTVKKYTIFGDELVFPITPGGDIEVWYYKSLAPLSSALNGLFTENPDLYLYAALAEAAPFILNAERMAIYEAKFKQIVDSVNADHKAGRYPSGIAVKVA